VQYSTTVGVTIDMTVLKGVEEVIGSQLNDAITGTSHADIIQGGTGDDVLSGLGSQDTLRGGAGNDTLDGGTGADTAEYTKSTDGVHVDLTVSGPQFISTSSGTDTLISIENVNGSAFDDVITGDGGANVLYGGGGHGADTIDGGGGNDVINGGPGADILTGGSGSDTFVYNLFDDIGQSTTHGTDLITDFDASHDHFAFGIVASVGSTPFQPSSLEILTTGAANSASFSADIANAVGTLASHAAVLFTASSGDLSGHTYLIVNGQDEANHFSQTDVVIELGPGSNLAGFSLSDFI
jgi:serralysin